MKVRIDTTAKTIAIEEAVTIEALLKFAKALFPDDYKSWKLETNVKFELGERIIYRDRYPWTNPFYYTAGPVCGTVGTVTAELTTTNAGGSQTFDLGNQPMPDGCGIYFLDAKLN